MADLLDVAIAQAGTDPQAGELIRISRRFEELRQSAAWNELRAGLASKREEVVRILGEKALKGADPQRLRDEGVYSRGWLDGVEALLERPDQAERQLELLINESYEQLRSEIEEATLEASPYA